MTPPDTLNINGITYHIKIDKITDGYALNYDGLPFGVQGATLEEAQGKMMDYLRGNELV